MLSRPESGARVIWLRVGNRSVSRVMTLVESRLDDIAGFVAAERSKILVIAEPRTA